MASSGALLGLSWAPARKVVGGLLIPLPSERAQNARDILHFSDLAAILPHLVACRNQTITITTAITITISSSLGPSWGDLGALLGTIFGPFMVYIKEVV